MVYTVAFCYYISLKNYVAVELFDIEFVKILVAFFVEEESNVVIPDASCDSFVVAVVNRIYDRMFAAESAEGKTCSHEIIRDNIGCERLERDTF